MAISFLTIIPLGNYKHRRDLSALSASLWAFPLVGLIIGSLVAATDFVMLRVSTVQVATVVSVTVWVALTGGMNLDGLADTFDGFLGGTDRERRLEIMRDSRLGAFGAVALILLLFLKVSLLSGLTGRARLSALLLAPVLGRAAVVGFSGLLPASRADGLGKSLEGRPGSMWGAVALTIAIVILGGWAALVYSGAVALVAVIIGRWSVGKIGGYTGDVLGSVIELSEAAVLLVGVLASGRI